MPRPSTRFSTLFRLTLIGLFTAAAARAELRTVTSTADDAANPPEGSLRRVIADAASGDTIQFAPAVTGAIILAGAEIVVDKNITIVGPGASTLAIDGNQQSRILTVTQGASATISGLTLSQGRAPDGAPAPYMQNAIPGSPGGAIQNRGNLLAERCRFIGNRAGIGGFSTGRTYIYGSAGRGGSGGAIFSDGVLDVVECVFDENAAGRGGDSTGIEYENMGSGGHGGAIAVTGGSAQIRRSTISNNRAGGTGLLGSAYLVPMGGDGGGIYAESATMVLVENCTISGNESGPAVDEVYAAAGGSGGGIGVKNAQVALISCTIAGNTAPSGDGWYDGYGGGVFARSGSVTLRNTIVANNHAVVAPDLGDLVNQTRFTSGGHDLIGMGMVAALATDLSGDPGLGPLADNGGFTKTRALLAGSLAIESGDDSLTGTDQRGQPRHSGLHVDIGAYEAVATWSSWISFPTASAEVNEGVGNATFVVQRTGDLTSPATVLFFTVGYWTGFQSTNGTVQFTPGQSEASIQVPIPEDANHWDRFFEVRLQNPTDNAVVIAPRILSVRIVDNEPPLASIQFMSAASTPLENAGNVLIHIERTVNLESSVSVSYATVAGTASAGSDYTSTSGTVTFEPGVTQRTIVVPLANDAIFEADETFTMTLSNPTGAVLGAASTHSVTIQNDDPAPPVPTFSFENAGSAFSESAGTALIKVRRSANTGPAASVSYTTAAGTATANSDFIPASGTLSFSAGVTEQTIAVTIAQDTDVEANETLTLTLSNPTGSGAVIGANGSHTLTIVDDDAPAATIAFASASSAVVEGVGIMGVTLTRSGNPATACSVQVTSSSGTAASGEDFGAVNQMVSFAPGATSAEVTVSIMNDQGVEPSQDFSLALSQPAGGAVIGSPSVHMVTITDDDEPIGGFLKAAYHGLGWNASDTEYAGFSARTLANGRLTGVLRLRGGKDLRLRGSFSSEGSFSQTFPATRGFVGGMLTLSLSADRQSITGIFTPSAGGAYEITAARAKTGTRVMPVPEANYYTAFVENPYAGGPPGYLCVTIGHSGAARLKGRLPDGTHLSSASHVTEPGELPIFMRLYRNRGQLAGPAQIALNDAVPVSGQLHWRKPSIPGEPFWDGVDEPVELVGAPYAAARRERMLDDYNAGSGAAELQVHAEDDDQVVTELPFTWQVNNIASFAAPNEHRARITFRPATGLFSGQFKNAAGKWRRFHGVCVEMESGDLAAGFSIFGETSLNVGIKPAD